jgi:cob(I)alamin adenosyltransferase
VTGYVQVYTGDGKGKTTAALGLAVRAAGAGMKVFIAQFIKSGDSSERRALMDLADRITIEPFGRGRFIRNKPSRGDLAAAQDGLNRVRAILGRGFHDMVILDEACVAAAVGLFPDARLLELIDARPPQTELVFTGRGASAELIRRADLVTEMKAVKHYYQRGVCARTGIEK